jgi:hypothetical protein
MASRLRIGLRQRWQLLFRDFDIVLCPPMPTAAFPHDHSARWERYLDIDGATVPYGDQIAWASIATLTGFPATAAPIDRGADGLPIGVQIIGGYLEDRTTITFVRAAGNRLRRIRATATAHLGGVAGASAAANGLTPPVIAASSWSILAELRPEPVREALPERKQYAPPKATAPRRRRAGR